MKTTPEINPKHDLLADAYAILAGIPDDIINLNSFVTKQGPALDCGTICCGVGWLAQHPTFKELGLHHHYPRIAAKLFDIRWNEAMDMFGSAEHTAKRFHKNVLLNRIKRVLMKHGYPVNNRKMLPTR